MTETTSCTTDDPITAASELVGELDKALNRVMDALPRPLRDVYDAFCDGDPLTDQEVEALLLHTKAAARTACNLGPTFRLFARQTIVDEQRLSVMLAARRRHQTNH